MQLFADSPKNKPQRTRFAMDFYPKQQSSKEEVADASVDQTAKDSTFKEEFMNQLKLMDMSLSSPSHLISPITLNFGFSH